MYSDQLLGACQLCISIGYWVPLCIHGYLITIIGLTVVTLSVIWLPLMPVPSLSIRSSISSQHSQHNRLIYGLMHKTVKEFSESQPRKPLEHPALKFLATMTVWTLLSFYWSPQNKFSYADLKAEMSSTRQIMSRIKILCKFFWGELFMCIHCTFISSSDSQRKGIIIKNIYSYKTLQFHRESMKDREK